MYPLVVRKETTVNRHVTLLQEDHRRRFAFHVYCVKCDWTYDSKDRVDAYKAATQHDQKGSTA